MVRVACAWSGTRGTASAASTRVVERNRRIRISWDIAERGTGRQRAGPTADVGGTLARSRRRDGATERAEGGTVDWILYAIPIVTRPDDARCRHHRGRHQDKGRGAPDGSGGDGHHGRPDQAIQQRKLPVEVGVAFGE